MANCLVERERSPLLTVTPSIYPSERRATVSVTAPTGSALGVYDIRQTSERAVDVTYWSIYGDRAAAQEATLSRKPIAAAIPEDRPR